MVDLHPIKIGDHVFTSIIVKLPKTNFMAITSEKGYIMCGALDIRLFNENHKLRARNIVAGRAIGVRTIDDLLEAPLESVTVAAELLGITPGTKGKEALLKMV